MRRIIALFALFSLLDGVWVSAQNPLITDQFTADPTARVFQGKLYVYPSHDIDCGTRWFCMRDYHVFSSENLADWTDHGVILSQEEVPWVDSTRFSMWAPDCVEKGGKYYFYFPAIADSATGIRGMAIGVAVSDHPEGPFSPEPMPIAGVSGIDPDVFINRDGQAYLYWAGRGHLFGARLKDNMKELESEPQPIAGLPEGMKEGPFVFRRNGIFYFTFPHVIEKTEALVYGMGKHPLGPFEYKGILMDEHPSGCWTNHHSIVEYGGQWVLFYHHNDLSPEFDKNRSIRADSLFFNDDGTLRKVVPTLRGVGLTPATSEIQPDRYSGLSATGASIAFLDTSDVFLGWKTILDQAGGWVAYNRVDFGQGKPEHCRLRIASAAACTLAIETGSGDAFRSTEIRIPASPGWETVDRGIKNLPPGVQDLRLVLKTPGRLEIDWLTFY